MANQRADIKDVKLESLNLCLDKFHSDISQYDGFRKNNSPFYGGVLSPWWKKEKDLEVDDVFIAQDGDSYYTKDGSLFVESEYSDVPLELIKTRHNITKTEIINSGNRAYSNILAFLSQTFVLASDKNGDMAIVNCTTGDIWKTLIFEDSNFKEWHSRN